MISDLLPALERAGTVTLDGALAERIIRRELKVRAYFDRENNLVLCRVAFLYGDTEIDPFAPQAAPVEGDERIMLLRDAAAERRALDLLAAFGFRMQKGRVILGGQEPIYRFLTEGIYRMQENAEVYCSDEFRKMTPRKPHFVGTLRMQDGALRLEMTENGEPAPEVVDILRALRDRKKYFRLKDGSFLDLSEMDEWREMAEAAVGSETGEPEDEEKNTRGVMEIATYRAAYMTSLLESGGIPVKVEDSVKNMVGSLQDDGEPCPAPLDQLLRPYQMRGFMWMQALDRLRMGGILADDMGLGKTLQVITLLLWAKRRGDQNAASIVVAPTSLVYNWMAEIAKFAPELRCVAGEGTQAQRAQTIARLSGENRDVDVYLTSYPLIRRDIGLLSKVPFRFAILDEAQYIKNAMSVGAGAVKQLKAQTRLALTGTPMENHPGELWSIFDFVLPGYLNSFAQFMHRFGTGEEADVLRSRIRPFLLRRLKGDVLRELPEKVEITLTADMTEEQRRVYQASLLRLRPQVEGMFSSNNRIEMLAAITELRRDLRPSVAGSAQLRGLERQARPAAGRAARLAGGGAPRAHLLPVHAHAQDFAAQAGGRRHLLHVSGRRNAAQAPHRNGAAIQRGRGSGVPDFAQGGRLRPQPRRRGHGDPLRPVVEPGGGGSGDRPRAPHRPEAQGHGHPHDYARQHRGAGRQARREKAGDVRPDDYRGRGHADPAHAGGHPRAV